MRILLLRITFIICLILSLGFKSGDADEGPSEILGSWEYSTLNLGLNSQKGIVIFTVEGGELKGNVSIGGHIIPMRKLVFEDDKVRAYIFLNGMQVDLYLKFHMDYSFDGTVSNASGYFKVMGCKKD